MRKVESPPVHAKEPGILTVAETLALFRANEKADPEICGLRALALKRAGLLVEADDISTANARRERKGLPLLDLKPKCPPKNALRHSFVTYHVALHRNPGKTALIISHRDQDCLYRHYLGIANQKDAAKYFEIRPGK